MIKEWTDHLWLLRCLLLLPLVATQQPHLNLPLPDTSFSCEGKVIGGYYADFATNCQNFHVCNLGAKGEIVDFKFACLQGTVFDQRLSVCEREEEVTCVNPEDEVHDNNLDHYQSNNNNKLDFTDAVIDTVAVASNQHSINARNFPVADYKDDYSGDQNFTVESSRGGRNRPTRLGVPILRRPSSRQSRERTQAAPRHPAFSRFQRTTTPPPTAPQPPPPPTAPAPIIVANDPLKPLIVVTNGLPFTPRLDDRDRAPDMPVALPDTNFSCADKISGGFYADPETDCTMFHICVIGPAETITDNKFLCGNNTAFDQKTRTCQEIEKVDCSASIRNYNVNNHLIIPKWLEDLTRLQTIRHRADQQKSEAQIEATRREVPAPHRGPTILRRARHRPPPSS